MAGKGELKGTEVPKNRTAIVFVHGQGEQTPLKDLRELAYSVWQTDRNLVDQEDAFYWSVPNPEASLNDTRRLTTDFSKNGTRYDFHEFYWADLMTGNRFSHVWTWFSALLAKPDKHTPPYLKPVRRFIYAMSWLIGFWILGYTLLSATYIASQDPSFPRFADSIARIFGENSIRTGGLKHKSDVIYALAQGMICLFTVYVIGFWLNATFLVKLNKKKFEHKSPILSRNIYAAGTGTGRESANKARKIKDARADSTKLKTSSVFGAVAFLLVLSVLFIFPGISQTDISFGLILGAVYLFWRMHTKRVDKYFVLSLYLAALAIICNLIFVTTQETVILGSQRLSDLITYAAWIMFSLLGLQLLYEVTLFMKKPGERMKGIFIFIIGLTVPIIMLLFIAPLTALDMLIFGGLILGLSAVSVVAFVAFSSRRFLLPVMGDSARYLSKNPENIKQRQLIHKRGLALLSKISSSGKYNRVVVLAHSLGSVVAYDVLNAYWGMRHDFFGNNKKVQPALEAVEAAMSELEPYKDEIKEAFKTTEQPKFRPEITTHIEAFRAAQRRYAAVLKTIVAPSTNRRRLQAQIVKTMESGKISRRKPKVTEPWLIDKFITIGSPLRYGPYLHGDDTLRTYLRHHEGETGDLRTDNFNERIRQRELPICPPYGRIIKGQAKISYRKTGHDYATPQHGAVFAAVSWTNIFFPVELPNLISGDVIGGPVRMHYGIGIEDVPVKAPNGKEKDFLHSHYWQLSNEDVAQDVLPDHIDVLRKALSLY